MTAPDYTDEQFIEGLQRLRRFQRTAARTDHALVLPPTFTAESTALRHGLPHWCPDNILALLAYPVEGGWNADVVLRDAPDGYSIVLDKGTGQPFATRQQAEAFLLYFVIAITAAWDPNHVLPSIPAILAA